MDRSLFKRAVVDNEEPTPGYIYREMAQWTFKDYNTQMKFIDALFDKLKSNTGVHALYKVLRIIKTMCETGHSDFQRELKKNSRTEILKTFANYRGKPDLKYGDSLNEKVRQSAREAIEAIFTHRKEGQQIEMGYGNNGNGNGNTTMGQSSFTTGYAVKGETGERPMGMYGGNIAPMPMTNKWAEHMAKQMMDANTSKARRVLSSLSEKAKSGFGLLYNTEPNMRYRSAKDQLYENALRLSTTGPSVVTSSQVDAGGFQPVELSTNVPFPLSKESGSGDFKFVEEFQKNEEKPTPCETNEGNSSSSFLPLQQQLTPFQATVQRLCQMKGTPQRVELHTFVEECRRIGMEMMQGRGTYGEKGESEECWEELAEALDSQLAQKHPWQRRLNALVALEALLQPHVDDAETAATMRKGVMCYFLENPEDVQRNVFVVQATLRERAQRVLGLLGLPGTEVSGGAVVAPNTAGASTLSPLTEAQQFKSEGSTTQSFLWSAPVSTVKTTAAESEVAGSAMANMSGMSVRVGHRGAKDKTTLRKRAPMSLHEESQKSTDKNYLGGSSRAGNMGKEASSFGFLTTSPVMSSNGNGHKTAGAGNTLDDLFGEPATDKTTTDFEFYTTKPPPLSHAFTETGTVDTQNSNATAFDFLMKDQPRDAAQFTSPPEQKQQHEPSFPFIAKQEAPAAHRTSASAERPLSPLFGATSASRESGMVQRERGGIVSPNDFSVPSLPLSSADNNSLPAMLLETQQQLQALMSNMQGSSNPERIAQLQLLLAQQQQLMALYSQQQQQEQQGPWIASSSDPAFSFNVDSAPLHSHFAMGVGPSSTSLSNIKSNTFAKIQEEMMAKLATSGLE
ncbi:hypothetical protein MOQ_003343 [Trypanosoma cruzi marinkellei]|uniref:ENTH domain-containing protein n=1 Tax=Trypanosoma cruzi marinkellei TaxID=85056 RepID=K2ND28_TRYCR|nr:hypothetical protein MOQ_003343 [Trypanosoma cruzi marinkellei]